MATASTTDRFQAPPTVTRLAHPSRAVSVKPTILHSTKPWWEGPDHSEFTSHFDTAQRRHLIEDDLFAGTSVAIVLTTVVGLGLLAMAVTVLFTLT